MQLEHDNIYQHSQWHTVDRICQGLHILSGLQAAQVRKNLPKVCPGGGIRRHAEAWSLQKVGHLMRDTLEHRYIECHKAG